jgi:hypothetical protein
VIANDFGVITMDAASVGDEWNSGEALTVTLIDQDLNKNTNSNEDILISNTTNTHLVPSLKIGSPISVIQNLTTHVADSAAYHAFAGNILTVSNYSMIGYWDDTNIANTAAGGLANNFTVAPSWGTDDIQGLSTLNNIYFNWDMSGLGNSTTLVTGVCLYNGSHSQLACENTATGIAKVNENALQHLGKTAGVVNTAGNVFVDVALDGNWGDNTDARTSVPVIADIFSFGAGENNAIYRLLLEETGDNTATFEGTIEYTMLNQINIDDDDLYTALATVDSDIEIIVEQDMTDEDSPRVNYYDLGHDGVATQIADQMEAPTHSGVVSLDLENYKIADTVVVTLDDQDMNTDSELIDVYTTNNRDRVGLADATDLAGGLVLDITFDDLAWVALADAECASTTAVTGDDGLEATGFTLVETGTETGIFTGSFQVPTTYCNTSTDTTVTVTGTDIEVNYQDFRNASGESIEVGDGASINANTGSVAFDRTVYPVPYGSGTAGLQFLPHASDDNDVALAQGDVVVHVRVTDADYNVSAQGEDSITDANVTLNIERGSNVQFLATYGNTTAVATQGITEVSPDSGVFEADVTVAYTAGPENDCPSVFASGGCILQGDIITVEYTDNYDASGKSQTVTDSATFDLRNGVLQSDKSVYLIGSDMILTLIEPDFDLDNDGAQSVTLDLIEWDSDADTTTISDESSAFDPEPSDLRETGDSTGIFQVVIEIPAALNGENLDRGEKIDLEYTDWHLTNEGVTFKNN